MKHIQIDAYDPSSINKAIEELNKFEEEIKSNSKQFIKEIAKQGITSLNTKYAGLNSESADGPVSVETSFQFTDDSSGTLSVTGDSVLFLEFGTGITKADSPVARADLTQSSGLVNHGEYGKGLASNPKGWHYGNKVTLGINAMTPMYSTKKELEKNLDATARKVFTNDR